MLPYIVLGALALYAGYLYWYEPTNHTNVVQGFNQGGGDAQPEKDKTVNDTRVTQSIPEEGRADSIGLNMRESGMTYSLFRAQNLNLTNLNEDYKPYSAPIQESTYSMNKFLNDQAKNYAYLEANATPFYFTRDGEIPLATAQQSNPNVEVPSTSSIRGDRNASLANYDRVYVDEGYDAERPFSTAKDRLLGAGEPTETEVVHVPEEGRLNRDWNPYGPGGVIQDLYNKRHAYETQKKGADQTHIAASRSAGARFPGKTWFKK